MFERRLPPLSDEQIERQVAARLERHRRCLSGTWAGRRSHVTCSITCWNRAGAGTCCVPAPSEPGERVSPHHGSSKPRGRSQ
ncbi:hypothetical protein [Streptomyces sp. JW3]|uniref:hypothetical protein n=1 Tax=Streptomyces sp. JW3 TaxID=3456955 RepID=UPI003FA46295